MLNFNESKRAKLYWLKRILAIDFGEKFTGIAMFTPGNEPYPTPYDRIRFKSDQQLAEEIFTLAKQEMVEVIILGVPRLTDGQETNMTKRVRMFLDVLRNKVSKDILIFEQDETLSTFEAKDRMKNSPQYNFEVDINKIDALSASIILEEFIMDEN